MLITSLKQPDAAPGEMYTGIYHLSCFGIPSTRLVYYGTPSCSFSLLIPRPSCACYLCECTAWWPSLQLLLVVPVPITSPFRLIVYGRKWRRGAWSVAMFGKCSWRKGYGKSASWFWWQERSRSRTSIITGMVDSMSWSRVFWNWLHFRWSLRGCGGNLSCSFNQQSEPETQASTHWYYLHFVVRPL